MRSHCLSLRNKRSRRCCHAPRIARCHNLARLTLDHRAEQGVRRCNRAEQVERRRVQQLSCAVATSAVLHAVQHIKPRLWPRGVVANPRDTTRYRCGLRLATGPNPSVFLSASQHATLHQEPVSTLRPGSRAAGGTRSGRRRWQTRQRRRQFRLVVLRVDQLAAEAGAVRAHFAVTMAAQVEQDHLSARSDFSPA